MMTGNLNAIALYVLQAAIGLVWIAAAVGKARTPAAVRERDVSKLLGGPSWVVPAVSRVLPVGELAVGLFLLGRWNTAIFAAVSAALFFFFTFLVGRATIRNSLGEEGCGCFGARKQLTRAPQMIGPQIIARNLLLANLSLVLALAGRCSCSR